MESSEKSNSSPSPSPQVPSKYVQEPEIAGLEIEVGKLTMNSESMENSKGQKLPQIQRDELQAPIPSTSVPESEKIAIERDIGTLTQGSIDDQKHPLYSIIQRGGSTSLQQSGKTALQFEIGQLSADMSLMMREAYELQSQQRATLKLMEDVNKSVLQAERTEKEILLLLGRIIPQLFQEATDSNGVEKQKDEDCSSVDKPRDEDSPSS